MLMQVSSTFYGENLSNILSFAGRMQVRWNNTGLIQTFNNVQGSMFYDSHYWSLNFHNRDGLPAADIITFFPQTKTR